MARINNQQQGGASGAHFGGSAYGGSQYAGSPYGDPAYDNAGYTDAAYEEPSYDDPAYADQPTQAYPYGAQAQGASPYGYGAQQAPTASPYDLDDFDDNGRPVYAAAPAYANQGAYAHAQAPKRRGPRGTTIAAIALLVVGVALIAVALGLYLNNRSNYQVGIDEYDSLAQNVTEDSATNQPIVDFATLKLANPEVVAWVQIPNTPVNYPVVQHADNDYYLEHTFTDQYNLAGSVFMDYRSDALLGDYTTVIYGHHLKNGEMFAKIADYSEQSEFDTLGDIYLVTEDGQVHVLSALACMVISGYDVDAVRTDFADDTDFATYVQSLIDRSSAHVSGATASGISHVYLFSTCSYARDNDRTILIAVDKNAATTEATDATQDLQDIQGAADEAAAEAQEVAGVAEDEGGEGEAAA